eukprot:5532457-Pleurochrysis_carterae.AAC.1
MSCPCERDAGLVPPSWVSACRCACVMCGRVRVCAASGRALRRSSTLGCLARSPVHALCVRTRSPSRA